MMQENCFHQAHMQEMMFKLRPDCRSPIDLSTLNSLQRILLTTDGTLTKILEAYLLEEIQIVKLSERSVLAAKNMPLLELESGNEMIERKILLQGRTSRKNFLYAESLLVPGRLDERFRDELLETEVPLGKLMLMHRMETFKEIVIFDKELLGELAVFFRISDRENLLSRTYRLFHCQKPVMLITEKFPESYFLSSSLDNSDNSFGNFK